MKASVIISAYNNLEDLRLLLPSIEKQQLHSHDMEVIVRDDGSADDTCSWVKKNYDWVQLIQGNNVGFSRSNNFASRRATGDILVFINADTILDQNFIAAGLEVFEQDTRAGGVNCNMIMPWVMDLQSFLDGYRPAAGYGFFLNRYGFADYQEVSLSRCETRFLSGGGCFVRRAALGGEPPFLEDLWGGTAYCEDLYLSLRLLAKGWRLYFESKAVLYHNQAQIQGSGLKEFRKFVRVSANRITVYALNLSLACFLQFAPGLFYGMLRKISGLPMSRKMRRKAMLAASMTMPFFFLLLPYWIYRNLSSKGGGEAIDDLDYLKGVHAGI